MGILTRVVRPLVSLFLLFSLLWLPPPVGSIPARGQSGPSQEQPTFDPPSPQVSAGQPEMSAVAVPAAPAEPAPGLATVSATASAIAPGYGHTCALLDTGQVKCWGYNGSGQLGLGDTSHRGDGAGEMGDSLPAASLGVGRTASAIAGGGERTCALLDTGQVKCWGLNNLGQLGLGDTNYRGDGAGGDGGQPAGGEPGHSRYANEHTNQHADEHGNPDEHADRDAYAHAGANAYRDQHGDQYANGYADEHADQYANPNQYADQHANSDEYGNPNEHTDQHADADLDAD
ncbi:MAG: hypothetical protein HY331_01160 [Chloroflexi bacterium]|nr:hypothetical protein [Chloroflexota bacterium]